MGPGDENHQEYNDANSQYDKAIDDAITSATVGEEDVEDEGGESTEPADD